MNLLDIIGPVMVGPSSSHTAGAVKIGLVSRKILGEPVAEADIYFHGSFRDTGKGHGTDRAIVAGLLGLSVDDRRIPDSFALAKEKGLIFHFYGVDLGEVHPNTAKLVLTGVSGKKVEIIAASIGGGRIQVCQVNGFSANFSGDYPTLIIQNQDRPGCVTHVTSTISDAAINIATMQLYRMARGKDAVMIIECDRQVPPSLVDHLRELPGILEVTYLDQ